MNVKKLLLATVAVGIASTILDGIVQGQVLQGMYYSKLTSLFRADAPMAGLIGGGFVAALVFVWVYARVCDSFGGGPKGGATYGLYAGVLVNFPTWIFMNMLIVGFPYSLAWVWTIYGIVATVILGAVAGATYNK